MKTPHMGKHDMGRVELLILWLWGEKPPPFYEETYLQCLFGPFKKRVFNTHENCAFTISSQTFVHTNLVYFGLWFKSLLTWTNSSNPQHSLVRRSTWNKSREGILNWA
jgi:hypothetical protein